MVWPGPAARQSQARRVRRRASGCRPAYRACAGCGQGGLPVAGRSRRGAASAGRACGMPISTLTHAASGASSGQGPWLAPLASRATPMTPIAASLGSSSTSVAARVDPRMRALPPTHTTCTCHMHMRQAQRETFDRRRPCSGNTSSDKALSSPPCQAEVGSSAAALQHCSPASAAALWRITSKRHLQPAVKA